MTREQEKRGYELVENAFSYPGFKERNGERESIRVWVYPSFQPFVSFTVSKFKDGDYVRRVIWDYATKTLTDEPQTYCSELEVNESVFEELKSTLADVVVAPFKPAEMLGIDGIRFGVMRKQFMAETTLHWWGCFPEEWHALRNWHDIYIRKLGGLFDSAPINIEQALTSGSTGQQKA
jgi:hypothetical protein